MLENGMFLIERYEILSKVGAGGMSDVYKAKDHVLGRIVAIKVLKNEFSEDVNFVTKFRTEAQSAAGLEHPNIVNIYDVGSENGLHFIVMEYVEGITLKTYVEKKGQLSFKEATSIAIQVARGIEAAHGKEIIHRDIKPQNVIISTEGKVKVTDFGIARAISSNTISAEVMGSVHYASPEQARNGFVDGRSDIYSLGIVMYEMVTGRVPFDGDTTVSVAIQHLQEEMVEPSAYAPELPISYEKIVLKATQKNPDRRYQTIEELLTDLRKALANPEDDFVVIAPAAVAKTRVIGGEELETIQTTAAASDLEKENVYAHTQDDDELDEYDDYDDEDDEDKGFLNPVFDKIITGILIVLAIAIVGVIIWLGSSLLQLFEDKPPVQSGNSGSTIETPSESDSEDSSTPGTSETEESTDDPSLDPNKVQMPNVVGWTEEQAKQLIEALGLKVFVYQGEDETKEEGTVLSQSEIEGAWLEKGATVYITVVEKIPEILKKAVPDVLGLTPEEAKQILVDAGFVVEDFDYAYSSEHAEGLICLQTPNGGKKVKIGSTVKIYISKGPAPVMVPSESELVGKHIDTVTYILGQLGFTVDVSKEYRDDITKDYVISVEQAGTEQLYGSAIKVLISAGSDAPQPDDPPVVTYEYVGVVMGTDIPATAKWYTYKLFDASGNEIAASAEKTLILNGVVTITIESLTAASGYVQVSWYEETTDEAGTPTGEPKAEAMSDVYTGPVVDFTKVESAGGEVSGGSENDSETNTETNTEANAENGSGAGNVSDEPSNSEDLTPEV